MEDIRARLSLDEPSSIPPDSKVDLTLQYANRNHNTTHHLETITLSPTWDFSQEQTYEIDQTIPARTKQQVLATALETPSALGGRHGVNVSFEIEAVTEDGDIQSGQCHTTEPLTVPVTGARYFQAVVCTADEGELAPSVRRLIQYWGFDIYLADDVRTVKARLTEFDDSPALFVGVVSTEGDDEHGQQLVSSATWAAADNTTLSVVLTDEGVSLPELPSETTVFRCDLSDLGELLRITGPELLTLRQDLRTGQSSQLIEVLQNRTQQESKELLRALAYATLFTATGAPQTVLDSIEAPDELLAGNQPTTIRASSQWPMRGANPPNTVTRYNR